ncbi:hypothetical protein SARC_13964, partial [Sphaeroforma arctica JP610]
RNVEFSTGERPQRSASGKHAIRSSTPSSWVIPSDWATASHHVAIEIPFIPPHGPPTTHPPPAPPLPPSFSGSQNPFLPFLPQLFYLYRFPLLSFYPQILPSCPHTHHPSTTLLHPTPHHPPQHPPTSDSYPIILKQSKPIPPVPTPIVLPLPIPPTFLLSPNSPLLSPYPSLLSAIPTIQAPPSSIPLPTTHPNIPPLPTPTPLPHPTTPPPDITQDFGFEPNLAAFYTRHDSNIYDPKPSVSR